jgi:hypothetical protein
MSGTPISRVVHYRIRTDTDAIDASPTWAAAEDTAGSVTVGTAFRPRVSVENTGTGSDTITEIRFSRCGLAVQTWGNFGTLVNGADAGSSADATAITTQRLTSGTGTFANGVYDENENQTLAVANGTFSEMEWGMVFTGGASTSGVGGGETWTFEIQGLTNAPAVTPTVTTPDTNGSDFSHGPQLGGAAQLVANSANISMTTAAQANATDLVVVSVVCDNNNGADGDNSDISGVTIGGNAATKAVEYTNGQSAAQGGVTVSIWYLQLAGTLNAGSTITATFTNAATSGDKNCIQARAFTVAGGKTVTVEATNGNATDAANNPVSIDATTSNIECLRVAAYGLEEGDSTLQRNIQASNRNWSLWWVSGAIGYTTGTAATDVSSFVEANISTGTGAVADNAGYGVTGDWASAYVAFRADTGNQDLTPSLFTNSQTFHTPAITTGSVDLTPSLYTNSQTFYDATVTSNYPLTPDLYTNTPEFFSPTITTGAVTLTPDLFTNTNTFYDAEVSLGAQILLPDLYTNGQTFYSPEVTRGAVDLTPSLYTNSQEFFTHVITTGVVTLLPDLYTNDQTFFSPTITTGSVDLTPSLFTNSQTFFSPLVEQFAFFTTIGSPIGGVIVYDPTEAGDDGQELTPDLYTNDQTFFGPTVTSLYTLLPDLYTNDQTFFTHVITTGAVDLTPSLYTNSQTFFTAVITTGAVDLTPNLYTNDQTFFSATVTSLYTLLPDLYTNSQTFYSATITTGVVTLLPNLYTNDQTFFTHTITTGALELLPDLYTNSQSFFTHVITTGAVTLLPNLYTNDQTFYSATITTGAVDLTPNLYTNDNTFFSATVLLQGALEAELYTNAQEFFSPTVTPGAVDLFPTTFINPNSLDTNTGEQAFYETIGSPIGGVILYPEPTGYEPLVTRGMPKRVFSVMYY